MKRYIILKGWFAVFLLLLTVFAVVSIMNDASEEKSTTEQYVSLSHCAV